MSLSSWSQTSSAMFPSPSKRLVRSQSGLRIVSQHARGVAPWALEEPHWVKDNEASNCKECQSKFDFVRRRHHCRRCGQIFCGKCCGTKVQFHRMGFVDPVRVCQKCAPATKKEQKFFDNELKVLFKGAPFHIRAASAISAESFLYNVKLSSDEKFVIFDNHVEEEGESIGPVDLNRISNVKAGLEATKAAEATDRFTLTVREAGTGQEFELDLTCPPEPSRKPSMAWIGAFREGVKMVFESRRERSGNDEGGVNPVEESPSPSSGDPTPAATPTA